MSDITQIQVGSTTFDIKDANALHSLPTASSSTKGGIKIGNNLTMNGEVLSAPKRTTYYVKGTQTAKTGSWTGILSDVDALYEGLTIDYWLPYDGDGNATLNLTLKDGTTTGAINCYYSGTSRLTTHIGANNVCRLIYQTVTVSSTSYTGWWLLKAYDTNDRAHMLWHYGAFVADSDIYRYQLLFQKDENTLTPLNNANNDTGTSKTMLTDVEFDPFGCIYYWESTATKAANATVDGGTPRYAYWAVDLRYTFNCGTTLTAHKPLYLKTSLQSNGMVKLASASPLAQALPTTNDGYLYIYLGRTGSNYQLSLTPWHPIYYHNGTKVVEYKNIPDATTSFSGLMSAADKTKLDGLTTTYAPLASPALTGTPTAPTAADGTNTTQIATTAFVQSAFKANDAMIFKGSIGSSGATVTSLPTTHYQGWTYKVATAGTYAGQACEIGDTIICITDGTSANDAHWTVIQANIDGAVTGPASSTGDHVATFNGTSGKIIKDSGYTIAKSVPSNAVFTDTTYTASNGVSLSGTNFTNSGVRSISTGSANGTISVNTNGTSADVSVKGLGSAAYTSSTDYLKLTGGTLSGQLKTSFHEAVAMGAYGSLTTTVPNLCEELRWSNGAVGSVQITEAYTKDGVTIPTRWYNFLWSPHRSGGINGQASGDNCSNGSLLLMGMSNSGFYMIRYHNSAIAELKDIYKDNDTDTKVTNTVATTTKYYVTGTTSNSTNTGTQSFDTGIYATTTAGQLNATTYKVNEQVTLQWNSTDQSLDFVFL